MDPIDIEAGKPKFKKSVEDEEHERLIDEFITKLKKSYKKGSKPQKDGVPTSKSLS